MLKDSSVKLHETDRQHQQRLQRWHIIDSKHWHIYPGWNQELIVMNLQNSEGHDFVSPNAACASSTYLLYLLPGTAS